MKKFSSSDTLFNVSITAVLDERFYSVSLLTNASMFRIIPDDMSVAIGIIPARSFRLTHAIDLTLIQLPCPTQLPITLTLIESPKQLVCVKAVIW